MLRTHEYRLISLLKSLRTLNGNGYYPRMGELVRFDDKRETVPYSTMVSRRRRIRELVTRKLATWELDNAGHPVRLTITTAGYSALSHLGEWPERRDMSRARYHSPEWRPRFIWRSAQIHARYLDRLMPSWWHNEAFLRDFMANVAPHYRFIWDQLVRQRRGE